MNNLPWFPLLVNDWLVGTAGMTKAEKGVFIDLLCYQWQNGSLNSIPNRLPIECAEEWAILKSKFIESTSGELVNPKLHKIRIEKEALLNKQVEGGRKGARSRYGSPTRKAIGIQSQSSESEIKTEPEKEKKREELTPYELSIETYFRTKISGAMIRAWYKAHPTIQVQAELPKAKAWLFANQHKQYKRFGRFLGGWMTRAANPPEWVQKTKEPEETEDRSIYA